MHRWFELQGSQWIFRFDLTDIDKPRSAAAACDYFQEDDEDEWVDDRTLSCLNCCYRRWQPDTFECMRLSAD